MLTVAMLRRDAGVVTGSMFALGIANALCDVELLAGRSPPGLDGSWPLRSGTFSTRCR